MNILTLLILIKRLNKFKDKKVLTKEDESEILFIITVSLLTYVVDEKLIKILARFLTKQTLDDIIVEKNIEHICGYLMCDKIPKKKVKNDKSNKIEETFQIYHVPNDIALPGSYKKRFCSKLHYKASAFYAGQLSNEALFLRKGIFNFDENEKEKLMSKYDRITCLEEVVKNTNNEKLEKELSSNLTDRFESLKIQDKADSANFSNA